MAGNGDAGWGTVNGIQLGEWGDYGCLSPEHFVCEGVPGGCAAAPAPPVPPPPPSIGFGDTCYYFSPPTEFGTWFEAKATCENMGAYLTTIDSLPELTWVVNHLNNNGHDRIWIGLNDEVTEGSFVWADGSANTWAEAPWYGAEPNGGTGGAPGEADCVRMAGNGDAGWGTVNGIQLGEWGDYGCLSPEHFVCEGVPGDCEAASAPPVPPPIEGPGGTCYYFSGLEEFGTWFEARTSCENMGGYLTTVDSADELEWVVGHLNFNGHDRIWIGLNDDETEGSFVWADGSALQLGRGSVVRSRAQRLHRRRSWRG